MLEVAKPQSKKAYTTFFLVTNLTHRAQVTPRGVADLA